MRISRFAVPLAAAFSVSMAPASAQVLKNVDPSGKIYTNPRDSHYSSDVGKKKKNTFNFGLTDRGFRRDVGQERFRNGAPAYDPLALTERGR